MLGLPTPQCFACVSDGKTTPAVTLFRGTLLCKTHVAKVCREYSAVDILTHKW